MNPKEKLTTPLAMLLATLKVEPTKLMRPFCRKSTISEPKFVQSMVISLICLAISG